MRGIEMQRPPSERRSCLRHTPRMSAEPREAALTSMHQRVKKEWWLVMVTVTPTQPQPRAFSRDWM